MSGEVIRALTRLVRQMADEMEAERRTLITKVRQVTTVEYNISIKPSAAFVAYQIQEGNKLLKEALDE